MIQTLIQSAEVQACTHPLLRNVKSIRRSQSLFDDLSDNPDDWSLATHAELQTKPSMARNPVIHRPFNEAELYRQNAYPFQKWQMDRYSDGQNFGVWYGAADVNTTIHETVHCWHQFLSASEGLAEYHVPIIGERKIYQVQTDAQLLDFSKTDPKYVNLVCSEKSLLTHELGKHARGMGFSGIVSRSNQCEGNVYAIFSPDVLSDPQAHCFLTYKFIPGMSITRVERKIGVSEAIIPFSR